MNDAVDNLGFFLISKILACVCVQVCVCNDIFLGQRTTFLTRKVGENFSPTLRVLGIAGASASLSPLLLRHGLSLLLCCCSRLLPVAVVKTPRKGFVSASSSRSQSITERGRCSQVGTAVESRKCCLLPGYVAHTQLAFFYNPASPSWGWGHSQRAWPFRISHKSRHSLTEVSTGHSDLGNSSVGVLSSKLVTVTTNQHNCRLQADWPASHLITGLPELQTCTIMSSICMGPRV